MAFDKIRQADHRAPVDLTCNDTLREHIRSNLQKFEIIAKTEKDLKQAAVSLTVVNAGQGPDLEGVPADSYSTGDGALVLTRRSLALKHHAGQWALPGGRIETGESVNQAALRELAEEVGLLASPGATPRGGLYPLRGTCCRSL